MIFNFRNVPDVFLCIMDSVEECCQGDKDQIDDTLKSVTTALLHACPGECSPAGAADCTTDIIENSCTELVTSASGDPCTLLIKEYFKYEHCITFNTGVCTEDEKISTNTTVSLIKREINLMCNDTMSSTLQPPVTAPTIRRPRPTHNPGPGPVTPSTQPIAPTGKNLQTKLSMFHRWSIFYLWQAYSFHQNPQIWSSRLERECSVFFRLLSDFQSLKFCKMK